MIGILKPTRGLSEGWSHLPRERKLALASIATLMVLFVSLLVYDRFTGPALQPEVASFPSTQTPKNETATTEIPKTEIAPAAGLPELPLPTSAPAKPEPKAPTRLVPPLAGDHKILQPYAFMYSEIFGDYRLHPGVDYAAARGESVMAAAGGTVVTIETDPVEGRLVEVDHGGGMITRYAGLGQVMVSLNGTVQAGHIIGQVGDPSPAKQSLGSHLHFEVLLSGNPIDPVLYYQP